MKVICTYFACSRNSLSVQEHSLYSFEVLKVVSLRLKKKRMIVLKVFEEVNFQIGED